MHECHELGLIEAVIIESSNRTALRIIRCLRVMIVWIIMAIVYTKIESITLFVDIGIIF